MEKVLSYIHVMTNSFSWRSCLDLFLISTALFFLYRIFRKSSSWRILLGIFVAMALFIFARIFNLVTILWIFGNLSNIALIALVIIFQPEIRKVFEKAALTLKLKKRSQTARGLSDIITDSAFAMSRTKWGAIIVLPGKDPLAGKVSGGIELDAVPSLALITSIFDHHSPGHDGAMIIEEGRVSSFALRLPLSDNEKLDQEFGTRHYASLGLSEVTDALIIAVSEETGDVTLFHEGGYYRVLGKKALKDAIEDHWKRTDTYRPVRRDFAPRPVLALEASVSLLAAFLLWSAVIFGNRQSKEMTVTVPVDYNYSPKKIVLNEKRPASVRLTLSGPVSAMNRLNPRELRASVDLSRAFPGKKNIPVDSSIIQAPRGISVLDSDPPSLKFTVFSSIEQEAVIQPQFIGTLPEGLEFDKVDVNPGKISVIFSSSREDIEKVHLSTTPIYLNSITEDMNLLCKLIVPANIYPMTSQWPDVVVSIKLRKKRGHTVQP